MLHVAAVVATHVICGASLIFVTQFAKVGAVAGSLPTVSHEQAHSTHTYTHGLHKSAANGLNLLQGKLYNSVVVQVEN